MSKKDKPILLRYGGAQKSVFEMNQEELQEVAVSALKRAKEKAFYKGLPIYYADKGKLLAEYSDGRVLTVKTL